MNTRPSPFTLRWQPILLSAATLGALASTSPGQVLYSIDFRGPSNGTPATGGGCIGAGEILLTPGGPAFAPIPAPGIFIPSGLGGLGLVPIPAVCICPPPGVAVCAREVDALSLGFDTPIAPMQMLAGTFVFSVDACSMGIAGAPLAPNVATETPIGDSPADTFESLILPPAPVGPFALVPGMGNTGILDGNGLVSPSGALYRGLGLVEPRMPGPAITGDDVDALDIGPVPAIWTPVYFSLDSAFPNACSGMPNSGSAALFGFPPAAVLVTPVPGGPPVVYAPPALLGLDAFGAGTDDLDALALAENGVVGYQPSLAPYGWLAAGADMLLFSVRRGSAVVGMPDSIFGLPIEPGDILVPPVAGGLSPFPGIFVAAEALGLATVRAGAGMAAELDALDTVRPPQTGVPYCFGSPPAACPCGHSGAPGNGCANSGNPAGANIAAAGIASVLGDSVVLTGTGMPPGGPCLYFQGTAQASLPFGDGILCIGGVITRLGVKFNNLAGTSTIPSGIDPPLSVMGGVPAGGGFRFYSCWYRDAVLTYCTPAAFNVTNGVAVIWTP